MQIGETEAVITDVCTDQLRFPVNINERVTLVQESGVIASIYEHSHFATLVIESFFDRETAYVYILMIIVVTKPGFGQTNDIGVLEIDVMVKISKMFATQETVDVQEDNIQFVISGNRLFVECVDSIAPQSGKFFLNDRTARDHATTE